MRGDPDAVVIGSGPNGLVAACVLARAGLSVLVLEANPRRPGGALGSEEAPLPGYRADVGAAFFPFASASPAFRELELGRHGLTFVRAPIESCHPAPDGTHASITRLSQPDAPFGSPRDAGRWRALAEWHAGVEERLLAGLLGPFPALGPLLALGPANWLRLGRLFPRSGAGLARALFQSEAARRVLPGLALHVDLGPDDAFSAPLGYMLGLTATTGGYAIPVGGAQAITDALVALLERHGGRVRLGSRVAGIVVREGQARGVRLTDGTEVVARQLVMANTSAPSLLLDLLERHLVPGRVVRAMQRFPWGFGTFKLDFALSGPVPWAAEPARRAAVVHAGDSLDDLARFTRQVRGGALPENPYLVMGQQSLFDATRAPEGRHALWLYSRVPHRLPGGWSGAEQAFADRVEARIEALAPGFRALILGRRVVSPEALERMDENLVGGDLGGGSNAWHRQLLFRPVFPWFRYRMPVRGLYLCSSYAHPGAGVHGMCGHNAARAALADLGARGALARAAAPAVTGGATTAPPPGSPP